MQEIYLKESEILGKTEMDKERELIRTIIKTREELKCNNRNFEYAKSGELVDYYTYEIKANQAKLDYLIKLAKTKGIKVDKTETTAKIDVNIIVEYGSRIPDVAFEIQNRVKKAVESMTGFKVEEVNVHVQGVNTDIAKKTEEKPVEQVEENKEDKE